MLPKLKELFQIYNNEMRQIKNRQLIEQQKQMKSSVLEEKFKSKPVLKQDANDRTQNNESKSVLIPRVCLIILIRSCFSHSS